MLLQHITKSREFGKVKGVNKELQHSIKNECCNKNRDEKTTFQIRIIDDTTGKASYKYLTSYELLKILTVLDSDLEWS